MNIESNSESLDLHFSVPEKIGPKYSLVTNSTQSSENEDDGNHSPCDNIEVVWGKASNPYSTSQSNHSKHYSNNKPTQNSIVNNSNNNIKDNNTNDVSNSNFKSMKLALQKSLECDQQSNQFISLYDILNAWPVIKSNFMLMAVSDQAQKIIVQIAKQAKYDSAIYHELMSLSIKQMMQLAKSKSGAAVLFGCAKRLVADGAQQILYQFAQALFDVIFEVHKVRPEIDLLNIWSTVLCADQLHYVHSLESWENHYSLDQVDNLGLRSPLLSHIQDIFETQIVECNSKMVSIMANHIVKHVEIYKIYKTVIKSLYDKMILLVPRTGFEVVQQNLFKKLCCNDIKFLVKYIEKNIKKVLKNQSCMNQFSWILKTMSSTNFAVFIRDLTFQQPTIQIKSDLLYILLKNDNGIRLVEEIVLICKNNVQVSRLKSKLGQLLAHFNEHNVQFKLNFDTSKLLTLYSNM